MKKENKFIIFTELWSIIAMILIFFKILLVSPQCFSIGDSYFTILPLFITKVLESKTAFKK